jgi:hypothetical protein
LVEAFGRHDFVAAQVDQAQLGVSLAAPRRSEPSDHSAHVRIDSDQNGFVQDGGGNNLLICRAILQNLIVEDDAMAAVLERFCRRDGRPFVQ